jgi:ribonucleotide reductase alpha subunit
MYGLQFNRIGEIELVSVVKRDGFLEEMNPSKISNAVIKAMKETKEGIDFDIAYRVVQDVVSIIEKEKAATVEAIQDLVEQSLMKYRPDVAKRYIIYREERAKIRKNGWEMTDLQRNILDHKYINDSESFAKWLDRVSGGNKAIRKRIANKQFLFGGRILSNRGLHKLGIKVTYSNCYVLPAPLDNLESIFGTASDMARTYSYGGGVGISLRNIRPRDAKVHNNAKSTSGAVSFMPLYSLTTETIGQKGRRGALMISIPNNHPDLEEFITVKSANGVIEGANISIEIYDDFMIAVEQGLQYLLSFTVEDTGEVIEKWVDARSLYEKIILNNYDWGDPGCLFWDRISNYHLMSADPTFHYDGTNPCLRGDSLVQTSEGEIAIEELVGKTPDVYCMDENGELTIKTASKVWKTKENAKVVKVVTGKGEIVCTPDHRILTTNRGWIEAKDLVKGDKIKGLNRQTQGHKWCSVGLSGGRYEKEHRFIMRHYENIEGKDVHHLDDNGFNNVKSNLEAISHSKHSKISNTGRKIEVNRDVNTGQFLEKEVKAKRKTQNLGKQVGVNWFVQEVVELEETFDVYDMTVPEVHNFIANGMVVHNCGEEPLPAGGSCLLGSNNLSEFVKKPFTDEAYFDFEDYAQAVQDAVVALNEVLDEGLPLHPLEIQRKTVEELRQIGLKIS